ncbi:hypothetical protein [Petroclostridium sp. X23]|uniref:hypothetical protein n=1 Tax=Petroclostridium sp. X23 TaxID=3045146 RepID=UPI0024AE2E2D|nr:hypothetical protein [Petroclostridium sp. X23]WHH60213.1 hypothetical protein QKW49_05635 [Petroclostridium sp. X23]
MTNYSSIIFIFHINAKTHEYAQILTAKDYDVIDRVFAGGLAREDHIFKALALRAPFTKLVCIGRALMIPGFLGANIEEVLYADRKGCIYKTDFENFRYFLMSIKQPH